MGLHVLVVDAEPRALRAIARDLRGLRVERAADLAAAMAVLVSDPALVAVVSSRLLGVGPDGLALLAEAAWTRPCVLRVLITDGVDEAIEESIRTGVVSWLIERPWPSGAIAQAVRRGVAQMRRQAKGGARGAGRCRSPPRTRAPGR